MLLRFAGFEDNNLLEISPVGDVSLVSASPTPRTGTYCLKVGTSASQFIRGWVMPINAQEFYFQFALSRTTISLSQDDRLVFLWRDSSGNRLGGFYLRTSLIFDVYVGDKATLIGSTATPLSPNWSVFEGHIKIHKTEGSVVIKVNGVPEVEYNNGDTQPGVATEVASIAAYNFVTGIAFYDDIVVVDTTGASFNSWPMGIKCHKVAAPLANGNYAQWTPSAGQNFECIDESPPSMDDYVEGAIGEKDSYAFGDAPVALSGIAGVVVRYYGQGNGDIKRLCRHGGVDYLSDAFTVPGTFNKVDDVMPEKPGGGGWDETVFNACEFGMEHQ